MRQYIKKELLELQNTISSAFSVIIKLLTSRQFENVYQIISDVQQALIDIGETIEKEEGEGTRAVKELEQACEKLYLGAQAIGNSKSIVYINAAKSHFFQCIQSIQDEIPNDKLEVVFLPYKASMWDSLESVWMKTIADENCNAYVIPIPYYDKKTDGSFDNMYYEGTQYPDNVPIVDWKTYDFETNRPDVIYIHNPYDNSNYVTSVHPFFYAENLRNYTSDLVYIPYFVGIDNKVSKEFCLVPAALYAHRVLVESDQVRQIYVETLKAFEKENNCEGAFGDFDKKIQVYHSPKYDKVKITNRENITIPREWEKQILRPDGGRKKVFFYNITIDAMLKHTDVILDKIRNTLQIFKECSDVVLLWRPHPLYETTMKSMRPELLNEYISIVKQYCEEGWGIFDDTADLNRAIALSDAYYGDWSSVVELYKVTNKPIMIQNYDILGEKS